MAPQLWFKGWMVDDILTGRKRMTVRAKAPRVHVGDLVIGCVGAARPFALLRITRIRRINPHTLPKNHQESLIDIYGEQALDDQLWRIDFECIRAQNHH